MFSRRWRLPPPTSKTAPPKQALPDRYESPCDWSWIREFRATPQVCYANSAMTVLTWVRSECREPPTRRSSHWAVSENATVVTLDADFHTILAVSGAAAPSVIRLRRQGLRAPAVVEIIRNVRGR